MNKDQHGLYLLSPEYRLKHVRNKYYLFKDDATSFLINEIIYQFLFHFNKPNQLLNWDAIEKKELPDPGIFEFFKTMVSRRILVPVANDTSECRTDIVPKFQPGEFFREFFIKELISHNAFLETYDGIQDDREFILKVLNLPAHLKEKEYRQHLLAFRHEMDLWQVLPASEYTPRCELIFKDEAVIVFEKVHGLLLHQYLSLSPLSFEDKSVLIENLISGMAHLHRNGIVHGDLHHGNLLVSPDSMIKIIDLDLAKLTGVSDDRINKRGGYYPYLPPERIVRDNFQFIKGDPDFTTDVYQIGLLIYLIIYEKLAFAHEFWENLYDQIHEGSISLNPEKEYKQLNQLIIKCITKDPKQRLEHAMALQEVWNEL